MTIISKIPSAGGNRSGPAGARYPALADASGFAKVFTHLDPQSRTGQMLDFR